MFESQAVGKSRPTVWMLIPNNEGFRTACLKPVLLVHQNLHKSVLVGIGVSTLVSNSQSGGSLPGFPLRKPWFGSLPR